MEMNGQIEYWYVEYDEKKVCESEWERKAVCIARNPEIWLKCKKQFEDARFECGVDIGQCMMFRIVNANTILKSDYDIFIGNNTELFK